MKHSCPDHPKTKAIAAKLNLRRYQAIGLLESLWQFTAVYAKRGDIGRWTDAEIASAIDWDRTPQELIESLLATRFLDACPVNRLLVHDWKEHADQGVQRSEEVKKLGFASVQLASYSKKLRRRASDRKERKGKEGSSLKEGGVGEGNNEPPTLAALTAFDAFWAAYPRRIGKIKAREVFAHSVKELESRLDHPEDPAGWIIEKAAEFGRSPAGQQGKYTPHPATWLHHGRYDDDPGEWQRSQEEPTASQKSLDLSIKRT
jgi:hypothetical protein